MRKLLLGIALTLSAMACNAQEPNLEVPDILQSCDQDGYFVYDTRLYMCNFVRGGVTNEALKADSKKQKQRTRARWNRRWGIEE